MAEVDDEFFKRADEHIILSNDQLEKVSAGKVSASMMYAVARFNAWVSARGWRNVEEMKNAKQEAIEYFVGEYKKMLEENMDDYIQHFDKYMSIDKK